MSHLRRMLLALTATGIGLAGVTLWLYHASQRVPEFYAEVLHAEPVIADRAGDELEQQVVALHNELQMEEAWELLLTDQQVNGWLAVDLPAKFPGVLPEEAEDPRVAFRPDLAFVACRFNSGKVRTVVSLKLQPFLTDQPNEIAVRVVQARAGSLPIPLQQILEQISIVAFNVGLPLRWTDEHGDPVALVTLPVDHAELRPGVMLQYLDVFDGGLRVGGIANAPQSRLAESKGVKTKDQR